jgi:hypothetical protein
VNSEFPVFGLLAAAGACCLRALAVFVWHFIQKKKEGFVCYYSMAIT